jgi:DDE superfamily endonuclease
LTEIFEPATCKKAAGKPQLLICNGHESHIISEFMFFCLEHNIHLYLLLPHSSHLPQTLNVGGFGPLKNVISAGLDKLLHVGINRLEKVEWVECYMRAQDIAMTESNIQSAWCSAGLVSLNQVEVVCSLPAVIM